MLWRLYTVAAVRVSHIPDGTAAEREIQQSWAQGLFTQERERPPQPTWKNICLSHILMQNVSYKRERWRQNILSIIPYFSYCWTKSQTKRGRMNLRQFYGKKNEGGGISHLRKGGNMRADRWKKRYTRSLSSVIHMPSVNLLSTTGTPSFTDLYYT